jgi:hypothetical protein
MIISCYLLGIFSRAKDLSRSALNLPDVSKAKLDYKPLRLTSKYNWGF